MIKVTVRPASKLVMTDAYKIKIAKAHKDVLQAQAKAGIAGGGNRLLSTDKKRLDLFETGALWNEARIEPLKITFTVDYAVYLYDRFKFTQLTTLFYNKKWVAKIQPLVQKGLRIQ